MITVDLKIQGQLLKEKLYELVGIKQSILYIDIKLSGDEVDDIEKFEYLQKDDFFEEDLKNRMMCE